MAADPSDAVTLVDAIKFLAPLVGGGGLTAIAVAYFGSKRPARERPPIAPAPVPVPIQVESPWLVQNILEMKLEIEGIRRGMDGNTAAAGNMAMQINVMVAMLKQRERRRKKSTPPKP